MDYPQLLNYTKGLIDKLGIPIQLLEEISELYHNFKQDNLKSSSHFEQKDILKCITLCVARKNGYYILLTEILENEKPSPFSNTESSKNKRIRSLYRKLKAYLNNPPYMNFNTNDYIDRVGQLLDLQYKDLQIIFSVVTDSETPVSILAKFQKHLNPHYSCKSETNWMDVR